MGKIFYWFYNESCCVFKLFIIIDYEIFNMVFEGYENGGIVGLKFD